MHRRILGLSPQAGGERVGSNTIDLLENDFGLFAEIGAVLRQFSVASRLGAYPDSDPGPSFGACESRKTQWNAAISAKHGSDSVSTMKEWGVSTIARDGAGSGKLQPRKLSGEHEQRWIIVIS
jgi:hypothetical protein